jgi:hypothetical protein
MNLNEWKSEASCKHFDTELFFEKYEEDERLRPAVENICSTCPVMRTCFAVGVSQKEWGVWGGVYLEGGKVSREFAKHRSKKDWGQTWKSLTTDRK